MLLYEKIVSVRKRYQLTNSNLTLFTKMYSLEAYKSLSKGTHGIEKWLVIPAIFPLCRFKRYIWIVLQRLFSCQSKKSEISKIYFRRPTFFLASTRETAEDRQKVDSLELFLRKIEEVIALTPKDDIVLTLDSRLSANFRQK